MSASAKHAQLARRFVMQVVAETDTYSQMMVVVESTILAAMLVLEKQHGFDKRGASAMVESAPQDGTVVWVYAPAYEGLSSITCLCAWNEDAGWCVDDLRQVTMWQRMLIPAPPEEKA